MMLVVIALFLLGSGAVIIRQSQPTISLPPQAPQQQVAEPVQSSSHNTIIYGTWESNQSVIHGVNADGTGHTVLAKLPFAIKNVRSLPAQAGLPGNRVIYISDTDARDHGQRIAIRDLSTNNEQTVVETTAGRGIDSFIVSSDARWISYWEVELGADGTLINGKSFVYSAKLDQFPAIKNTLFTESAQAGAVIHYPLFFDHHGMIYADGFSPNKNGWNQGLVQTTVDGANPNPVTVLPVGSYNSDPVLSPGDNAIAYTAYDASNTAPLTTDSTATGRSSKQALNPNTIQLMDVTTGAKTTLLKEPGRLYYDLTWKDDGTSLFARSYTSTDGVQLSDARALVITLNPGAAPLVTQLDTTALVDGIILGFGADGIITGTAGNGNTPGNLGATYEPILSGFSIGDGTAQTTFAAPGAQFIATVPGTLPVTNDNAMIATGVDSLQLATFNVKPQLNARPAQQNDPLPVLNEEGRERCRDIYARLTGQLSSTSGTIIPTIDPTTIDGSSVTGRDPSLQLGKFGPGAQHQDSVTTKLPSFSEAKPLLKAQYKCYDSPLYLYSAIPQQVAVQVHHAEILSSVPAYVAPNGWDVTATPEGSKIAYAYAAPFVAPEEGYIIPMSNMTNFLGWYGTQLGLIDQELADYVSFWAKELPPAAYYHVAHFDNPDAIMHFEITPKPGTMIQAIMYFKPLTASQATALGTLSLPVFNDIPVRTAFTAVDWSGIIDN